MATALLTDPYGNEYRGEVTKVGRKYLWVRIDYFDPIPVDMRTKRTSPDYEDRNGMPFFLKGVEK